MTRILAIFLAITVLLAVAVQANANPVCASRTVTVDHLATKYSEAPVAIGLANNGGVIELLSSKEGTSWTIIITMPNGTACMIAAGTGWETIPQMPRENGT